MKDLAGHHIILRVAKDTDYSLTGFNKYMHVDRTPLTSAGSLESMTTGSATAAADPVVNVYKATRKTSATATTWGKLDGWLRNLASTMRAEQITQKVDTLHPRAPQDATHTSSQWSCPLRRISFWTQVTKEFSPLVPSPTRSARLFGNADRDMIHGTRSHPTQRFSSLYDKLADVSTSNGFCFCASWMDCQVDAADASATRRECSLLETIRSMYDQRYRTTRLLTGRHDRKCTQQLDWPFVGGAMRDGSVSPDRYSGEMGSAQVPSDPLKKTCNVLDRLPPFQYRWVGASRQYPCQ